MRFVKLALLGALPLLLGAVVAELALRRAGYGGRVVNRLDERLGWRPVPGQELVTRGGVHVSINSQGFRDREWDPAGDERAEERLLRVAVLGSSASIGGGVDLSQSWARLLEERLRAAVRGDPRWDDALVMNLSGPAYGVEQMARVHEDVARRYRPDVVIACVGLASLRPLRTGRSGLDYPLKHRIAATALYDWYQRELARVHGAGTYVEGAELSPSERRLVERSDLAAELLRDRPFSEAARPLWDEARARMGSVAADLAGRGGLLLVLCLPGLDELDAAKPSCAAERWRAWADGLPNARQVDPRAALRGAMAGLIEEVRARGLPARDLWGAAPDSRPAAAHADEAVFAFDAPGHLTPRGHATIAELLEAELADALLARCHVGNE